MEQRTLDAARLAAVARRYHRRRAELRDATIELTKLTKEARDSGMTLRAIALETGLSFARIHQLTKERKE